MGRLADKVSEAQSLRNPPYRPLETISDEERKELARKLGSAEAYSSQILRELVPAAPENMELRKAMVSGIMSAEFAGIDGFARRVCEFQEWDVPPSLIMAMARQTWDEVRHAWLAKDLLESYGGYVGEYPDTLAGGRPQSIAAENLEDEADNVKNPIVSLSRTNVSLEGAALISFRNASMLGKKIGDKLMEHCYDYNWADEVTHTYIGDWFVKELCGDDPEKEQLALRAHARHENSRLSQGRGLTEGQKDELRRFFAEEDERAHAALGGRQEETENRD